MWSEIPEVILADHYQCFTPSGHDETRTRSFVVTTQCAAFTPHAQRPAKPLKNRINRFELIL